MPFYVKWHCTANTIDGCTIEVSSCPADRCMSQADLLECVSWLPINRPIGLPVHTARSGSEVTTVPVADFAMRSSVRIAMVTTGVVPSLGKGFLSWAGPPGSGPCLWTGRPRLPQRFGGSLSLGSLHCPPGNREPWVVAGGDGDIFVPHFLSLFQSCWSRPAPH